MALSAYVETITAPNVGKTTFDLSFEGPDNGYLEKTHIYLWINDVQIDLAGGTGPDGFTWITDTQVTLKTYSPVLNDKIEFRRTMPTNDVYRNFTDGGGLTERLLDEQNLANLYIAHEILDGYGGGTQDFYELCKLYANAPEDYEVESGTYSAYHYSLKAAAQAVLAAASAVDAAASEVNAAASETAAGLSETAAGTSETNAAASEAAAGTSETNAATSETNALTYKNAAETAQTAAETAETNAETAETNAAASEVAAAASALAAAGDASDASDSADAAALSETAAETAQTAAELAETNAEAAEDKAQDWAEEATDVEVETGQYSAKHWATKSMLYSLGTGKNLLINPSGDIWQGLGSPTTGYFRDRWVADNTSALIKSTTNNIAGLGEQSYMGWTGASSYPYIAQRVNAVIAKRFSGESLTVSFWAYNYAGAGALTVQIRYATAWNDFSSTTIEAYEDVWTTGPATGWVYYTATFDNLSANVENGFELRLRRTATSLTTHTTYATGIKLEYGQTATPYVEPVREEEYFKCFPYRYTFNLGGRTGEWVGDGVMWATIWPVVTHKYPMRMREVPSASASSVTGFKVQDSITTYTNTTDLTLTPGDESCLCAGVVGSGINIQYGAAVMVTRYNSSRLYFDAEL